MVPSNIIDTDREISILLKVRGQNSHVIEFIEHFPYAGIKTCIVTEFCQVKKKKNSTNLIFQFLIFSIILIREEI